MPHIRLDMNLKLDKFVIMPNHFHGIIQIGKNKFNTYNNCDCGFGLKQYCREICLCSSIDTMHGAPAFQNRFKYY